MTLKEKIESWFCLHRWKVDYSSSEDNVIIVKCSVCFKTQVYGWQDDPEGAF